MASQAVADMTRERALSRALCEPEPLTRYLKGGSHRLNKWRNVRSVMEADSVFRVDDYYFAAREERYKRAMEKAVRLVQLVREHGWDEEEAYFARTVIREQLPVGLHWVMFIPAIKGQGTDEQQAYWLPKAQTMQIVGTYAQTELGHGTFLRGLETTAEYDPSTQEFIIHSPSLTATKWWPGTLGKTATHCIVMARLISKGEDHGTHAFIVQIRDLGSHKPLRGVTVGDIGPKLGYDSMDNGFLRFDRFRIPRKNMLMRYAQVAADGTYSKPPHSKLSYGTMIFVRSHMIMDAATQLQAATTIAIRYGVVRRQSLLEEGDSQETQFLDYTTQQRTLFTLLATAYAYHFASSAIQKMYHDLQASLKTQDMSTLDYTHGTTSGLKALCSAVASDGIEICRKCCGGHGYSKFSGFVDMYQDYVPACTYEGENIVMSLQCARYLLKCLKHATKGSDLHQDVAYIRRNMKEMHCQAGSLRDWHSWDVAEAAMEFFAAKVLQRAHDTLEANKKKMTPGRAWNASAPQLAAAARAHCELVIARYLAAAAQEGAVDNSGSTVPPSAREPLVLLRQLLALRLLEEWSAELVASGYLTSTQRKTLEEAVSHYCRELRPRALSLVDAFDLSDHFLNSALGRSDGNVYEALYENAQKSNLNKQEVAEAVTEHLLPLMRVTRQIFGGAKL